MTFRDKLADWISGGALTRAREWSEYEAGLARLAERRANEWSDMAALQAGRAAVFRRILGTIAAEEKPTSNATVRRMARMAREALK